jgi:SAM-dependent methyltransferase
MSARRRSTSEFDAMYAGTPPWDIGRPQAAFLGLAESGEIRGAVLDAGCGTGEHALMAAAMGLETTGVDTSPTAVGLAEAKANARSLDVRFLVADALELPALGTRFDTVMDSGLFHVFDDESRTRYVASLGGSVVPGGRYHMLCFSDRVPGDVGPRRVSEEEIRTSFADGWEVLSIDPSAMEVTFTPERILAWLATIVKR